MDHFKQYSHRHIYRLIMLLWILLPFCGCLRSKEKNDKTSLLNLSTQIINGYNAQHYYSLQKKVSDPVTLEIAKKWYAIAQQIASLTVAADSSVNACWKNSKQAGAGKTQVLLSDITSKYTKAVLLLDAEIQQTFQREFSGLLDTVFLHSSTTGQNSQVSCSEVLNCIAIIANGIMRFCDLKANTGCIMQYNEFSVLVGQNAMHFKAGDSLVINAGVGSFSRAAQPVIHIGNEAVPISDYGCTEFKKSSKRKERKT